jgi:hypothetical protein
MDGEDHRGQERERRCAEDQRMNQAGRRMLPALCV